MYLYHGVTFRIFISTKKVDDVITRIAFNIEPIEYVELDV
jgi:hypothetical protein